MELEQADLAAFEPELRRVSDLTFGAAGRLFKAQHLNRDGLAAALADPEVGAAIRRACHEAFKQTQQSAGESLAQLAEQTRTLERQVRQAREARFDTTARERHLDTLRNRTLVFRRLREDASEGTAPNRRGGSGSR